MHSRKLLSETIAARIVEREIRRFLQLIEEVVAFEIIYPMVWVVGKPTRALFVSGMMVPRCGILSGLCQCK